MNESGHTYATAKHAASPGLRPCSMVTVTLGVNDHHQRADRLHLRLRRCCSRELSARAVEKRLVRLPRRRSRAQCLDVRLRLSNRLVALSAREGESGLCGVRAVVGELEVVSGEVEVKVLGTVVLWDRWRVVRTRGEDERAAGGGGSAACVRLSHSKGTVGCSAAQERWDVRVSRHALSPSSARGSPSPCSRSGTRARPPPSPAPPPPPPSAP